MTELQEIEFPVCWDTPPPEILRTIEIADRLYEEHFQDAGQKRIPLLVNSNYYIAYNALKHALDSGYAGDKTFCEWGSGLGVVTCIASQLGYRAAGIEIEVPLCRFARALAEAAGVKADFLQSSYREIEGAIADRPKEKPFPLGQQSCNVVYVYPWPAEEPYIESLYRELGDPAALLISYHGGTKLRARQLA